VLKRVGALADGSHRVTLGNRGDTGYRTLPEMSRMRSDLTLNKNLSRPFA